jgi:periplasmic protein TonB
MSQLPRPSKTVLHNTGWVLVGLLLLGGIALLVHSLMQADSAPKRHVVTTITTVTLPPPPPPPPEPVRQPAEPQKIVEPQKILEPEPIKPEAQRPDPVKPIPGPPAVGFEGDGGAGGYGPLASGGTGIGGGGTGGGGSLLGWYAGVVVRSIQDALQKDEKTRTGAYRLVANLWLDSSGAVVRSQLVSPSGDAQRDAVISRVLEHLVLKEAPPPDMPQPVQVRIDARPPA